MATLEDARNAWSRGDFRGCLTKLDAVALGRAGTELWVEATLLRARAWYRLKQYGDAIALIEPALEHFADGDEIGTARMLLGSSIARAGDVERGLSILDGAAAHADPNAVHRAVRAEIAHARALAHWTRRELVETESLARAAEASGTDIISVRATQLRAFVALAQRRFHDALSLFNLTLDRYWQCRERDADLAEMTVHEIAALELMLRSNAVRGTHNAPDRRRVRDRWDAMPEATSVTRLQTCAVDAWLFAHDGDRDMAFRKMRRAEEMASEPAWRVWALAGRASLAAAFGEFGSAREHAALASELAREVNWSATIAEERVSLLLLAEVLTATDPAAAAATLKTYEALARPMDPGQAISSDPRLAALEEYVRALDCRNRRDYTSATALLRSVAPRYDACGNLWRAALARIELAATQANDREMDAARAIVAGNFPNSFLAVRVGIAAVTDPVVARLTPAQRDVLALLLDGLNAREIATYSGRAYNTVRVHIDRLREAFAATSIHALVVDCHRRGIVLRTPRSPHGGNEQTSRSCG